MYGKRKGNGKIVYLHTIKNANQTESQGGRKEEEGVGDGKAIVLLDGNKIVICGVYWFASYPLSF